MAITQVTRRQLLIGATGAVAITGAGGLWLAMERVDQMVFRKAVDRGEDFAPNAYLAIADSGQITIWVPRAEMGQGVTTALAMLLAEELDANWEDVRVEQAVVGTEIDYGQHFTAASSSIAGEYHMFRRAGATARDMLLNAAADRLSISVSDCIVANSQVTHAPSGRSLSFGELATLAKDQWAPIRPKLKHETEFQLVGQRIKRVDTPSKVNGDAQYGIDVRVPNMVRAVIARPTHFGAELIRYDDNDALKVDGVIATHQITSGVAIVAESTYAALEGRKRLKCEWTSPPPDAFSNDSIQSGLMAALQQPAITETLVTASDPIDTSEALQIEATYYAPVLAHACMEPMNCTAWVKDGACEIWAPSQTAKGAQQTAANIAGIPRNRVIVHVTQLGGGFGRRAAHDFVAECVELAKQLDRPVQVLWSREDDIQNAMYRPASAHQLAASVSKDSGHILDWHHTSASMIAGRHTSPDIPFTEKMGSEQLAYPIKSQKVSWSGLQTPIKTQIWRSVGYSYNTFVVESFINEIAGKLGKNPLRYRQDLIKNNARLSHCLDEVIDLSGWQENTSRHLGTATYYFSNTAVAMIAEIQGSGLDDFKVTNVWCCVDCGVAVNPDSVAAQIEGGIIDGMSAALYGKLTIADDAVQESNFHDYPLLRMPEAPDIQVNVVPSTDYPSGVGEASLPGIAPAVTEALFQLTGQRIRSLPIKSRTI